jgi:hypothetical protein
MLNVKIKSKLDNSRLENQKKIAPIFMSNGKSSTVIIPINFARKYAIDRPSYVTIEDTQNGILIKKLGVKD